MYEQRACFFAWLIMPFNSRSTTPLRRIISQWSWLFLLSHALSLFFFFLLIAKWIMDPTIFTRGRAASWRMGWPVMSIRGRHTDGGSLLLCCAHRVRRQLLIWPEVKLKDGVRGDTITRFICVLLFFSFLFTLNLLAPLLCFTAYLQSDLPVCAFLAVWQSLSAIHNVKWDHDCSAIPS